MSVTENLAAIRARLAKAALEAGRSPSELTLVAVCKRQPEDSILEALTAGIEDLGESTHKGLEMATALCKKAGRTVKWHFVGRLQTNKVKLVLKHDPIVHSLDRPSLADMLSRHASPNGCEVFIQVNIGREPQKGGVFPDDVLHFAREVAKFPRLRTVGLMGIPPAECDPTPYFDELRALRDEVMTIPELAGARFLSMGMSEDFEQAIRSGATHVRIGTALFGERSAFDT